MESRLRGKWVTVAGCAVGLALLATPGRVANGGACGAGPGKAWLSVAAAGVAPALHDEEPPSEPDPEPPPVPDPEPSPNPGPDPEFAGTV